MGNSCEKILEESKIFSGKINVDVVLSNKINNSYDMFVYIQKKLNISDDDLSTCEKDIKKYYYMMSEYTGPSGKEKISDDEKKKMKSMINNIAMKNKDNYKDGIPFKVLMNESSSNGTVERFEENETLFSTRNLIIMAIVIGLLLAYVYRDKLLKR
jgi:hypothetical protein